MLRNALHVRSWVVVAVVIAIVVVVVGIVVMVEAGAVVVAGAAVVAGTGAAVVAGAGAAVVTGTEAAVDTIADAVVVDNGWDIEPVVEAENDGWDNDEDWGSLDICICYFGTWTP